MRKIYAVLFSSLLSLAAKAQFPAPYCAEAFSSGVEPITSVIFNTINNTSSATVGGTAHENYTAISTTVTKGITYTLKVKGNTDGPYLDGLVAFIDFNGNNVFTDAGESIRIGTLQDSDGTDDSISVSILIPATATTGRIRMRVSKKYNAYPTPCNTTGYGQAEDYTLNIVAPPCNLPSNLQFGSVSTSNVTIGWTGGSGVSNYEYAVSTSATPPATGTTTNTTTATVSGLPANTVLYAYVRSVCSAGVYTEWLRKAYVPCVSNVTPSGGATNVTVPTSFDWTNINGASRYQILLSTNGGASYDLSGVFGTPPATNISGLSQGSTYRWYVRGIVDGDSSSTSCSTANSTSFTTALISGNDSCGAPIALSVGTSLNTSNYNATQSLAPVSCNSSISSSGVDVWYSIIARSNGTATVSLTNAASTLDAVLVAYSGNCGSLTNIGCADQTLSGGNETISLTGLSAGQTYRIRVYGWGGSAGTFTITATGPALPVTGVSLSALRNGKAVQLVWKTETEINNTGFELQRSADGSSFTSFLKVASKANGGNSTSAINYTAEDIKPLPGANYYRLKQTDKDGKVNYSNIVLLKGLPVSGLTLGSIYPNPVRDVLKAAIQSPAADKVTFLISDMTGKTISRQMSSITVGDNTVNLNVTSLPSGNYLLKAICSNGCETAIQKFTKQ